MVEEERALAIAEIEKAKLAIERVEKEWLERETVATDKDQQVIIFFCKVTFCAKRNFEC